MSVILTHSEFKISKCRKIVKVWRKYGVELVVTECNFGEEIRKSPELEKFYFNKGWYCGYVVFAKDPFLGRCRDYYESPWNGFVVHGGITFFKGTRNTEGIIVGFDCNHDFDHKSDAPMKVLRNVERECENFAKEIMLWIYG